MVDTVLVSPTEEYPTHHLSLTDGVTTLGIVVCDRKGSPVNLAMSETPVPPTVTRVANTNSGYADFEQPYVVVTQDDWSGGRGQEIFEKDDARFLDSYRIGSWRGDLVCGPAVTMMGGVTVGGRALFFHYFGSEFVIISPEDGVTAPKMYILGLRGMAKSAMPDKSCTYTSLNLTLDQLTGCIIQVVEGSGFEEERNWRLITSNTAGADSVITVTPDWNVTQDATTRFVIHGMHTWTEVTGHGLTYPCTDVCVVDDYFYMCQGDKVHIHRGHYKADDTFEWGDEGGNKGTFLELIADKTGKRQVWKGHLTDVEVADVVAAWGTALTFGASIPCGNKKTKITSLVAYADPQKPYVMKEDCFGSVADSIWAQVPLSEMATVASDANGRAVAQNDVYLYFSLRDGLERYYQGKLDDIGPNKDSGLPISPRRRRGPITQIVSYPTGLFCVVDAGTSGYSSVMLYNKTGWHEFYRASSGDRIRRIHIQTIPGSYATAVYDRMFVCTDTGIASIPVAANPAQQDGYRYFSGGEVESSYIYTSLAEIIKYWSAIKVFTEDCSVVAGQTVTVEYRTDDDSAWVSAGTIDTSPSQKLALGNYDVTGRRLQYRLTLNTTDATKTPRVLRVLIEGVQRIPPARVWSFNFYVSDEWVNLQGGDLTETAKTFTDQLRTWADSRYTPAPLVMHSNFSIWDNIHVFIEPARLQAVEPTQTEPGRSIRLVGQMTLREAGA
jgi:hypothetical protein